MKTASLWLALALGSACGGAESAPVNAVDPVATAQPSSAPIAPTPTPPRAEPDVPPPPPKPKPTLVWTAPFGTELPCGNTQIAFTFDTKKTGYDPSTAFWMMWSAMRSFNSDKVETPDELRTIGFDEYEAFADSNTGLQGYVVGSKDAVIVAFRGSTELRDWLANFTFPVRKGIDFGLAGSIHRGFADALFPSWSKIRSAVARMAQNGQKVWVTGHSLGGAMATLTAARLARNGQPVEALYTFAAPRSGNSQYAKDVWASLHGQHYRFVNEKDLVPRLPPSGDAAKEVSGVAQFEFAENAAEKLVRDLGYAHHSVSFEFDAGTQLTAFPIRSDDGDKAYWGALVAHAAGGKIINLILDNQDQSVRHNEKTYLCKMRTLY